MFNGLFGGGIAAAGFVRRAGLRIIFFDGIHCIGFLLVIAPHTVRAGRFFKAVKSFHWRGRLRAKPGMRGLAGLQLVVVHFHGQPEQADGEKAKGSTCQRSAKGLHAAAPFLFLRGGRTFIFTPFT